MSASLPYAFVALEWFLFGLAVAYFFLRRSKKTGPTTKKTIEMDKLHRRVAKIPSQELGGYLESATVQASESVRSWTRSTNELEREALQNEAIVALKAQLALLEEQKARGIR